MSGDDGECVWQLVNRSGGKRPLRTGKLFWQSLTALNRMGQVMRATRGQDNLGVVNKLLKQKLDR